MQLERLIIVQIQMVIAAEQFFDQKLIKKRHISRREDDYRFNARSQMTAPFRLLETLAENPLQAVGQAVEYPAKMTVLKFQPVNIN